MSKLLLDEQPLLVMPQLAVKIGLNESIVLQQIHYWTEINRKANKNFKDDNYWVYNSYEEWQSNFPFWSDSTIKRTIKKLEKLNLIIVGNYNKLKIDRTKWYRIDYKTLSSLEKSPLGQNDQSNRSNCTDQDVKMTRPLPENTTEITSETKKLYEHFENAPVRSNYKNIEDFISHISEYQTNRKLALELIYFYSYYLDYNNGYNHYRLTRETLEKCMHNLNKIISHISNNPNMTMEDYREAYFNSNTRHNLKTYTNPMSFNYLMSSKLHEFTDPENYFEPNGELKDYIEE